MLALKKFIQCYAAALCIKTRSALNGIVERFSNSAGEGCEFHGSVDFYSRTSLPF